MSDDSWDPQQYDRYRHERRQPFFDLLALVRPKPAMAVIDLGCGTGELTRQLAERLQAASVLGVDSSEKMLAVARTFVGETVELQLGDIAAVKGDGRYDLVFSNAALHWLPDHHALFTRLTRLLGSPGGQLAVQIPANHDWHSHTVAAEVAGESPYVEALGGYVKEGVLGPERYAELLHRLGFREQHVRMQVYLHELPSRDHVVEWVRGSLLTAYQRRLPEPLWQPFLDRYRRLLLSRLDDSQPFLLPYKRILMWGEL